MRPFFSLLNLDAAAFNGLLHLMTSVNGNGFLVFTNLSGVIY